jgi:hypothetical protein
MASEQQNPTLFRVVAEICDLLANVIILAPADQRVALGDFALTEVAGIYDSIRQGVSSQH